MKKQEPHVEAAPSLPSTSGQFDALVREFLDRVAEMDERITSTMGTVVGRKGGGVIVHVDGERLPRTEPFARAKGVRYSTGQRVGLKRLRDDEWVVDGVVSDESSEVSVYREQIAQDAVGGVELAFGAVTMEHLEARVRSRIESAMTSIPANSIGPNHIQSNAIRYWHVNEDTISWYDLEFFPPSGKNNPGRLGTDLWNLVLHAKKKGWIPK